MARDLETQRHGPSVAREYEGFDVVVVAGPAGDTGKRATLDGGAAGKVLLGTGPSCDVRLVDPTISRRHASLELTGEALLVTDLDSMNGTFVNDARIVTAYVRPGDRLALGTAVVQVVPRESTPRYARPAQAFGRMAATSARMLNVFALCERLATTDIPLIVEGETGTGKELLAECIHEASPRAAGPFVVLDCRTTPRDLALAHLFGEDHGADGADIGILESASGGTLLLDEPGDLDLDLQTKLLRALDKGTITRVGSRTPIAFDARMLVATSQDLDKLVEVGRFREDLYYRLAGARIELPPLRRRREDIPLVASEIWSELGGRHDLPEEFLERYEAYDWPGNVRELHLAIERFAALGAKVSLHVQRPRRAPSQHDLGERDGRDEPADLLTRVLGANLGYSEARQRVLEEFERAYLEKALADNKGNVQAAAASSGIARRYFQRIRARQR